MRRFSLRQRPVTLGWVVLSAVLLLAVTTAVILAKEGGLVPDRAPQGVIPRTDLIASAALAAPADPIIHVVKRGETLSIIALRYGVGIWELADYNGISDPDRIYVGQRLRIPLARPRTPTPVPFSSRLPCPCEEIVIISPSRNMTVANPVTVTGLASSPFEQTVVVAVLDGSGAQIGVAPGIIVGEMGKRGPFTVTVPFAVPFSSQLGRIQVFTESPRDGAMEHLSSVTVNLQGLDLDTVLERLETAIAGKDYSALQSLMGPQFRFGGYQSEWSNMPAAQALEMLRGNYLAPGSPRLDFSVDARRMAGDRVTFPDDVIHVVFSSGWGANGDDDAFLLFGDVEGRARWTGLLYVAHDLIDYR